MMEMAIYVEDELHDVRIEYQDMWDYMKEISKGEMIALMAKKSGTSSRGGGGWLSTTVGLP